MFKPKILFLSPVDYFKGGAERSLFDLLNNPYITPCLAVPGEGEIVESAREANINCQIVNFGSVNMVHRPFSFIKSVKVLKSLLKVSLTLKTLSQETEVQVVHSNGLKAHFINILAYRLGGKKAVIHIRDIPYTKSEKIVWYIMYMLCFRMIIVSRACWPGESLPSKVTVIHNGIPVIKKSRENNLKISKKDQINVGFVGRIHPSKGLHLLLGWIKETRKNGVDISLSVRGEFSNDALGYESQIYEQIKKQGLCGVVEFLGFIETPDKVYEGLDVVVVPSKTPDPLPRAVMESMARGIPVLGYPAGGIFEMIEDHRTGFLVHDAESFYHAINAILSDIGTLELMTKSARDKIEQEFTLDNLYGQLGKIYLG